MYKVLIADDEDIIRRGLASMVSQHPKLEVVATAEDGEVALEKAKDVRPDLMLVDINMPFMNGFAFIEAAKTLLPEAQIIIVTGYDDFSFAKKALQLGVAEYIMKPVMEEPFFAVLDKAVARLDSAKKQRDYINWLVSKIEKNRPALINDFFHSWIRGSLDQLEIEDRMRYLNVRFPSPYCVTILQLFYNPEQQDKDSLGQWEDDLLYFGCENIASEVLEPYGSVLTFRTEEGALAIVSEDFTEQQWEEITRKMVAPIQECLCCRVELVQRSGKEVKQFPEIYETAMQIFHDRKRCSEPVIGMLDCINKQWGNSELSLQLVAEQLHMSAPYLSRLFHQETGENFAACLARKRMQEAMRLLQNPNLKMYEIARKIGYTSQHYFSNAFKKALGISPVEYRRNILEQGDGK